MTPVGIEIVYETHATSTDNELGFASGWLPGQLSARGRGQAVELGERRRHDGIAGVFVSDLDRAVQTADLAFHGSGIPVHLDVRLRECDYGDLNGRPVAELDAVRREHIDVPFPGGQSYREVLAATAEFLHDLTFGWAGQRVLFIAHRANKWALDCLLAGARLEDLVGAPFDWQPGWTYTLPDGAVA